MKMKYLPVCLIGILMVSLLSGCASKNPEAPKVPEKKFPGAGASPPADQQPKTK